MYPARYMWMTSYQTLPLNSASQGRGLATRPSTMSKPCGLFIHPLTAMTQKDPVKAEMTIGMPVMKWARRLSLPQP